MAGQEDLQEYLPVRPCTQALQWEKKYGPGDYVGGIQLKFRHFCGNLAQFFIH